jgi:hypothetical protein
LEQGEHQNGQTAQDTGQDTGHDPNEQTTGEGISHA